MSKYCILSLTLYTDPPKHAYPYNFYRLGLPPLPLAALAPLPAAPAFPPLLPAPPVALRLMPAAVWGTGLKKLFHARRKEQKGGEIRTLHYQHVH